MILSLCRLLWIASVPLWAAEPRLAVLPARYDFHLSSAAAAKTCADAKAKAQARLLRFSETSPESATLQNSFVALSDILDDLNDETSIPAFLGRVAADKEVRDAGMACDTDISQYFVDVFTRESLYKVLKAYADKGEALDTEDKRLVEKTLLEFKRNGLGLPPEQRDRVRTINQKIVSLNNDFSKNLAEEKTSLSFSKEQLAGIPEDFVARLARDGDLYKVSLDYPDYYPFMDNAKDPEARRLLESKFNSRGGPTNLGLMREALLLRAELARLTGYPTFAAYMLEDRMAKDPETVLSFLKRVQERLKEKAVPELATLLALKKEEEGDKSDGVLRSWDWRYYHNKLLKTRYQVDEQKIKEYFPVDVVTNGLLEVYQTLLGLKFQEVSSTAAWHADVKLYEVTEAGGDDVIGRFFMDLYPREGKYKHAAAFTLAAGRLLPIGIYQKPLSAIVANFQKPTAAAPSLLTHREVETLFHEFGHIMHQVLTKTKYERTLGSSVARDFVEAPSQMLEEWVWQEDVLKSLSGHYKSRSRKLPPELLKKMIAARNVDSGLIYLRQNFLATVDMTYHTQPVNDILATWEKLQQEISLIPTSSGTIPAAGFGHLMGGYEAGYYSYLWSKVYAEDMFSRFEAEGVLNPVLGREYRKKILEPGGGLYEKDCLRNFLGREPREDAFFKSIGLESQGAKPSPI